LSHYRILPERSQVYIDARSSVHPIHSSTDGLEGFVELELDGDGAVDLAVKPTGQLSFAVSKLASGNRMEDRELQKRLDSRRYPTIKGVLEQMEPAGAPGSYKVSGEITLKGVTRPHEDLMEIRAVDDSTISLSGKSRFDIREFGMEPPRVLILKVEPEVDVRVEIIAEKVS
jgi:polyisoprenoid-binding protein YceI